MPIGGTAFFGMNQHPRITTTYLNQLNRKGDPDAGVNVSTAQVSGSIVQPYLGFAGGKLTVTNPWAAEKADPAVGPLYGGMYQYVQFSPADTTPPARGRIVYWLDELNYIVTTGPGTTPPNKVAGVCLNAVTPGFWDFIQIAGIAMVLFSAAVAIGSGVAASSGQGAAGASVGPTSIGVVVLTAGVAGQVSPVELNIQAGYNF